ncbi:MAG: GNAT family N-acetyltransferase [Lachnospiraceae bacterium]|nr:GNAT family N-acetyltransferase [Lachnospiraceae bacterium]
MVRKATKKDISRIAEIIVFGKRVAYRTIFQNDEVSFNEIQVIPLWEEYKDNLEKMEHMLVFDDGIVKGVINCNPVGDEVEICEFYVEPFFKGQGIGRELIQNVIAEAKTTQKKRIFLWVLEENGSARRFYEANGFRASGETCLVEGTDKVDMCYEYNI